MHVRKDSELASASLSASLVSFERRRSSCIVIRAGILASLANMSNRKGVSNPWPGGFFNTWSNRTSLGLSFPLVGIGVDAGTCTDVVCCCVSSVAFSYYFRYDFLDRVPVG